MLTIKPLSLEVAVGEAIITNARLVRLVNTGATQEVTVANATPASFSMIANTSIIIEKEIGAAIGASSSVKGTVVAFTN
tara:strand:- start:369 stop:605 length:237 start_codon:yes stop_codon:yes gene_type:complete